MKAKPIFVGSGKSLRMYIAAYGCKCEEHGWKKSLKGFGDFVRQVKTGKRCPVTYDLFPRKGVVEC